MHVRLVVPTFAAWPLTVLVVNVFGLCGAVVFEAEGAQGMGGEVVESVALPPPVVPSLVCGGSGCCLRGRSYPVLCGAGRHVGSVPQWCVIGSTNGSRNVDWSSRADDGGCIGFGQWWLVLGQLRQSLQYPHDGDQFVGCGFVHRPGDEPGVAGG